MKYDLVIIDDMGSKQLPKHSGEYLLEVIMRRYENRSTIMTSNRPLEEWGKLLCNVPKVQDVEIDEVYSFVNCLQQNTTVDDVVRGDQYIFLAIEKNSKLILHHFVGKREKANAFKFVAGLKRKLAEGRFQLTSDAYKPYCGQLGAVFKIFRESIDYGTEQKEFATEHPRIWQLVPRRLNPVVCVGVKRTSRIGNPDRERMTTNHVERLNLSARLFNRRLTRKTMGFSKTLRNHKLSVALQVAHFNFCRVHGSLGKTPAQAAGLTDHAWTSDELLKWSEHQPRSTP